MKELHLTKKDFKLEWFSGSGAGGQHRNKHQNCLRITHIESGLMCVGQNSRSRVENQRDAFTRLAEKVIAWHNMDDTGPERFKATDVIRNYHACRNEVKDTTGATATYKEVVDKNNIGIMIEERRKRISDD